MKVYCNRIASSLLLLLSAVLVNANKRDSVSFTEFEKFWIDSGQILEDLDKYQALWIKVHNCVWSECAIDANDDDGENRDGDENWYAGRTQKFCTNAAYTLYGVPKNRATLYGCSRGNYINSYFTYGGSDTLLEAIGKNPVVYYDEDAYNNGYNYNNNAYNKNNNNNGDDDGSSSYSWKPSNDQCVVLEGNDNGGGSGDNYDDSYGVSSTLGCSSDGGFNIALFDGATCNGNHFAGVADKFHKYNFQMGMVGCHKIWKRFSGNEDTAVALLTNSWSCDLDLYPKGCPDPYGIKQRYANALHAVSRGTSPNLAVWNGRLKFSLRIISWSAFFISVGLVLFSFRLKNKDRIESKGGGLTGWVRVVTEDVHEHNAERKRLKSEARRQKRREKKREKKSKKKKRRKSRSRDDDMDIELSRTVSGYSGESMDPPGVMT